MTIRRTILFIEKKHRESVILTVLLFLLFSFFFFGVRALLAITASLQLSNTTISGTPSKYSSALLLTEIHCGSLVDVMHSA